MPELWLKQYDLSSNVSKTKSKVATKTNTALNDFVIQRSSRMTATMWPGPVAAKQLQITTLPPLCLTVDMMCLLCLVVSKHGAGHYG